MNINELKRIGKFILYGAVGFGLGGTIFGLAWHSDSGFLSITGCILWGPMAGTSLGLAMGKTGKRIALVAVLGAVGFIIGGFIGFLVNWDIVWGGGDESTGAAIMSTFMGTLGGAVIGFALKGCGSFFIVGIISGLGFSISSFWIVPAILGDSAFESFGGFALVGVVNGIVLGITFSLLDREVNQVKDRSRRTREF